MAVSTLCRPQVRLHAAPRYPARSLFQCALSLLQSVCFEWFLYVSIYEHCHCNSIQTTVNFLLTRQAQYVQQNSVFYQNQLQSSISVHKWLFGTLVAEMQNQDWRKDMHLLNQCLHLSSFSFADIGLFRRIPIIGDLKIGYSSTSATIYFLLNTQNIKRFH